MINAKGVPLFESLLFFLPASLREDLLFFTVSKKRRQKKDPILPGGLNAF